MDKKLINAAKRGTLKTVRKLIEAGANVNTNDGEPLIISSQKGYFEVAKILLENG